MKPKRPSSLNFLMHKIANGRRSKKKFFSQLIPKSQRNLIPLCTRPSSLAHATGIPASLELSHRALRGNIIDRQSLSVLMGTMWERGVDVASKVFRLVAGLNRCSELLEKFGGHEMAAGLTIRKNNFTAFAEKFRQIAREMLSDDLLQPRLQIDHELTFSELNLDLLDWHEALQPFGSGNRAAVVCCARSRARRATDNFATINISFCDCGNADVFSVRFFSTAPPNRFRPLRGTSHFKSSRTNTKAITRLQLHVQALRAAAPIGMIDLAQPLADLDWVPRAKITPLRRLEIETVEDLLTHFPRRHEDRREFPRFPHEESTQAICLCGEVVKTQLRRFGGWKKIFEVTLEESQANALSEPIVCRWFNLHYVQKMIATGQRLVIFGKPKLRGKRICIDHPEFEVIENDEEISIHFRRITPIYPATEGLSQRVFRGLIYRALQELDDASVESVLPNELSDEAQSSCLARNSFSGEHGNPGASPRASRPLGILCHANGDRVATLRIVDPDG